MAVSTTHEGGQMGRLRVFTHPALVREVLMLLILYMHMGKERQTDRQTDRQRVRQTETASHSNREERWRRSSNS